MDVSVVIARLRLRHTYGLVPAVHARDRVRLHWKRDILMHPDIAPPDTQCVRIGRCVGRGTGAAPHAPLIAITLEIDRRHDLPLAGLTLCVWPPPAHVMTARDNTRPNALGHPRLDDEMANARFNPHQITGAHAEPLGIVGVQP